MKSEASFTTKRPTNARAVSEKPAPLLLARRSRFAAMIGDLCLVGLVPCTLYRCIGRRASTAAALAALATLAAAVASMHASASAIPTFPTLFGGRLVSVRSVHRAIRAPERARRGVVVDVGGIGVCALAATVAASLQRAEAALP